MNFYELTNYDNDDLNDNPNHDYNNNTTTFINLIKKYEFDIKENNNFINAELILTDYNKINFFLVDYKKKYNEIKIQKDVFLNYQNNLLNTHLNIADICLKYNKDTFIPTVSNTTEAIINYDNLIKDVYTVWLENYYNPQIAKLEYNINISEKKLANFRKLFINIINNLVEKKDNIENKKMCSICFDNEINMCAIPCGHTCCDKCVFLSRTNSNNNQKCLNCRNPIQSYIKLFFSI